MSTPIEKVPSPVRRWIYTTLAAVALLGVFYGWATNEEVAVWLSVIEVALVVPSVEVARSRVSPVPKENRNEQNSDPGGFSS